MTEAGRGTDRRRDRSSGQSTRSEFSSSWRSRTDDAYTREAARGKERGEDRLGKRQSGNVPGVIPGNGRNGSFEEKSEEDPREVNKGRAEAHAQMITRLQSLK